LQETFLPEVEFADIPASVDELNLRAAAWLIERVHAVPSRSTGVLPVMRLELERPFLFALPHTRFDTDYVETRRVHTSFPFIVIDNIRYSVASKPLGQLVEIRRPVDAERIEIRWAGERIATHPIVVDLQSAVASRCSNAPSAVADEPPEGREWVACRSGSLGPEGDCASLAFGDFEPIFVPSENPH
jgi:hypothetical protein